MFVRTVVAGEQCWSGRVRGDRMVHDGRVRERHWRQPHGDHPRHQGVSSSRQEGQGTRRQHCLTSR